VKGLVNLYSRDGEGGSERVRRGPTHDTGRHIGAHIPEVPHSGEDWETCPCIRTQVARGNSAVKAKRSCKTCRGVGHVQRFRHTAAKQ
jgi:hypothetical protein